MEVALTPTQAAALAKRLRKLLRAGQLTHAQHSLADAILWACRAPGSAMLSVSYSRLQRLARVSRDTVARGIARLEALGVLRKTRRRVRIGWASRQVTNLYELLVPPPSEPSTRRSAGERGSETESGGQTVSKVQGLPTVGSALLENAIARYQRAWERRRADKYALQPVGM